MKIDRSVYDSNIQRVDIAKDTEEAMKIYGANINILRSFPSILDGLKPVERRVLFTMWEHVKCRHNREFAKVANITGQTMGLFHPHGDKSIEDVLVRLAQPWSNLVCVIDSQGNFGSPKGDPAGAARYIEAKLSYYAYKCFFEEFDIKAVDTIPNYTYRLEEPLFLPARYPNVLVNNVFGIGYGLSTGIPTFNLTEVFQLAIKMLHGEEIDPFSDFLIPDLPTGAIVIDEGQFQDICSTGQGRFRSRSIMDMDYENNVITIRNLPLMVNMLKVLDAITHHMEKGKLNGIKDIRDYSKDNEIRLELHFRPEVDLDEMYQYLLRSTRLENSTNVNLILVDELNVREFNLYSVLERWIGFRMEMKNRITQRSLVKVYERLRILDVLLFILNKDNAEKTLKMVKGSKNRQAFIDSLMKEYGIDSLKAKTIADMRIHAFSKEAHASYLEEMKAKEKERDRLLKEMKDKHTRSRIIEELEEGIELFGEKRRSKVIRDTGEPIIKDTEHLLVFTRNGLIKKLPSSVDSIGFIQERDYPIFLEKVSNLTELMIFDSNGKIGKLTVHEIPNSVLSKSGTKLEKHVILTGDMVAIIPKPTDEMLKKIIHKTKEEVYIVMVTQKGFIKKTKASQFTNIRKGLTAINLSEGDRLVDVQLLHGEKDAVVYGKKGYGIRFNTKEISEVGRTARGVNIMKMDEDDSILGVDFLRPNDRCLFLVTEKGYVKKISLDSLLVKKRNTEPMILIKLDEGDTIYRAVTVEGKEIYRIYQSDTSTDIFVEEYPESTRVSRGKKVIPVRVGQSIFDMKLVE